MQDNNDKNSRQYRNKNKYYNETNEYDYNLQDRFEDEDTYVQNEKENSFIGMKRLVIIQVIACIIIILFVFVFKSIGGQYYNQFKSWYNSEINKSIIVGDTSTQYKSASALISQNLRQKINKDENVAVNVGVNISDTNTTNNTNETKTTFTTKLTKPVENAKITSTFTDPEGHNALDLAANEGTDIVASLSGKVIKAGQNDSYGNYVILDNGNSIKTLYAHCKDINVNEGQDVVRGSKIATVGSTGNSTGPHVHFELLVNDLCYDPLPLIQGDYV